MRNYDGKDVAIAALVFAFTAMFWIAFPHLMVPYGLYLIGSVAAIAFGTWVGGKIRVCYRNWKARRLKAKRRQARRQPAAGTEESEPPGKDLLSRKRILAALTFGGLTASGAVWYTFTQAVQFSSFGAAYGAGVLGFAALAVMDAMFLPDLDLIHELRKGNPAVGLSIVGYCIVVAAIVTRI